MKTATAEQLQKAEELGITRLITPSMSSFEVGKILAGEIKNRFILDSKKALQVLLDRGLHCGCEIEQFFKSSGFSRWGVVYNINKRTGELQFYVNEGKASVKSGAKFFLERDFEKDPSITYVPKQLEKEIENGQWGEEMKNALQQKTLPKTNTSVCFLPNEFAKQLHLI